METSSPRAVARDQPARQVALAQTLAIELLDGVLLHEQPLIAALAQCFDVFETHVRDDSGRCISGGENPRTRASASQPKIAAKWCCQARMCSFRSGTGVDGTTAWPHIVPSHSTHGQ